VVSDFEIGEVFIVEFADRVGYAEKTEIRDAIKKILKSCKRPGDYNFYSKYTGGIENKSDLWKEEMKKFKE